VATYLIVYSLTVVYVINFSVYKSKIQIEALSYCSIRSNILACYTSPIVWLGLLTYYNNEYARLVDCISIRDKQTTNTRETSRADSKETETYLEYHVSFYGIYVLEPIILVSSAYVLFDILYTLLVTIPRDTALLKIQHTRLLYDKSFYIFFAVISSISVVRSLVNVYTVSKICYYGFKNG